MPIGIHSLTLHPEVREEDFERFMADELFPIIRTVINQRIGRVSVQHTLLKSKTTAEDPGEREYLWIIDVDAARQFPNTTQKRIIRKGDDMRFVEIFPTDIGITLKSKLDALVTGTFSSFGVLARVNEDLGTPTGAGFDGPYPGDPSGWFGPQ